MSTGRISDDEKVLEKYRHVLLNGGEIKICDREPHCSDSTWNTSEEMAWSTQFDAGEIVGDAFPSGQVTYSLTGGGYLSLWAGKRQAGQVCSGGVCKFEPAFEGAELTGVFRY